MNKIELGNKFKSVNQLVWSCGYTKTNNLNQIERYIDDISRYYEWELTGKINRNTGKPTKEIIITKVYDKPLPSTKDNSRKSLYRDSLLPLLSNWNSCNITQAEVLKRVGIIKDVSVVTSYHLSGGCLDYKYKLVNEVMTKVKSTLTYMSNQSDYDIEWYEGYSVARHQYDKKETWEYVDDLAEIELIDKTINDLRNELVGNWIVDNQQETTYYYLSRNSDWYETVYKPQLEKTLRKIGIYNYNKTIVFFNYDESKEISNDHCDNQRKFKLLIKKRMADYLLQNKKPRKNQSNYNPFKGMTNQQLEKIAKYHNNIFDDDIKVNKNIGA